MVVFGEDAMTFTIHASKNGQSVVTVRITPVVAVESARVLENLGWQVHITDSAGTSSTLWTSTGFHRLLTKRPNRLL
jgi:hypothetical protein